MENIWIALMLIFRFGFRHDGHTRRVRGTTYAMDACGDDATG